MLIQCGCISEMGVGLNNPVFHIVGDKFSEFADDNTVITCARAFENYEFIARNARGIVIGQGVGKEGIENLVKLLNAESSKRDVYFVDRSSSRAEHGFVQKREQKNVLITHPKQTNDTVFLSHLVVDDDCSDMSDHLCGEHVPGTLLVEAAKQMLVACALIYVLPPEFSDQSKSVQFTLKSMKIFYSNFIFPVEAEVILEIVAVEVKGASVSGSAEITFRQFDRDCCKMHFEANAYSKTYLKTIEKRSACRARKKLDALQFVA